MSKKHYVLIAAAIKEALEDTGVAEARSALWSVANALSYSLKQDNPAFDRERFLTACGFEEA